MIADDRGRIGIDDAAAGIDHHQRGMDTDAGEHGGEQRGLVLAVAVAVAEDIAGEVGLVAADAHLDGEVTDLLLNKLRDGFGLVVEVGLAGGEFAGLGRDLGRSDETIFREGLIPLADALPGAVGERGDAGTRVVDGHAACQRALGWTKEDVVKIDGRDVLHLPTPALIFEIGSLGLARAWPRRCHR